MRALYVEPFAGISGNMFLGALLDAGVPFSYIQGELEKLHLGDYELINQSVNKNGIQARYFNVKLPYEHDHDHEHDHGHEHDHHHDHEHDHGHEHDHHHDHEHDYGHEHDHDHEHNHHHEHDYDHGHEHDHHHDHEHGHGHEHNHHHEHRNLHDIETILDQSDLSAEVIAKAKKVFLAIAKAEAKVHGSTVEEIHFHEVGAIDTIIDVTGNILALDYLGIEKIFTAPVNTGYGFVECAHGQMPVPAPATAELLQNLPYYKGTVDKEMTTPTGAALLKVLAVPVREVPAGFIGKTIGYGAGTRNVAIPNVLRINLGTWEAAENSYEDMNNKAEPLLVLECNLDDMNPEFIPYVLEKLLDAGAPDAWIQPVIMKKGRPAHLLKVLCRPEQQQVMQHILFAETTTLGIRAYPVSRIALERRWKDAETPWGKVRIKEGLLNGQVVNAAPEFEDCRRLAEKSGKPLKTIAAAAMGNSCVMQNDNARTDVFEK